MRRSHSTTPVTGAQRSRRQRSHCSCYRSFWGRILARDSSTSRCKAFGEYETVNIRWPSLSATAEAFVSWASPTIVASTSECIQFSLVCAFGISDWCPRVWEDAAHCSIRVGKCVLKMYKLCAVGAHTKFGAMWLMSQTYCAFFLLRFCSSFVDPFFFSFLIRVPGVAAHVNRLSRYWFSRSLLCRPIALMTSPRLERIPLAQCYRMRMRSSVLFRSAGNPPTASPTMVAHPLHHFHSRRRQIRKRQPTCSEPSSELQNRYSSFACGVCVPFASCNRKNHLTNVSCDSVHVRASTCSMSQYIACVCVCVRVSLFRTTLARQNDSADNSAYIVQVNNLCVCICAHMRQI